MLTESGETIVEGNGIRSFNLPSRNSQKHPGKGGKEKDASSVQIMQGYGFARGYPFVAPSIESLTLSEKTLRMKPIPSPKTRDPWVARCRVAGVISGILLLVAFVVAFIEAGKGR